MTAAAPLRVYIGPHARLSGSQTPNKSCLMQSFPIGSTMAAHMYILWASYGPVMPAGSCQCLQVHSIQHTLPAIHTCTAYPVIGAHITTTCIQHNHHNYHAMTCCWLALSHLVLMLCRCLPAA